MTGSKRERASGHRGRWIGIDEAGYGPNLGPMVMTAVVAEGPFGRAPDVWADLPRVRRGAGDPAMLRVDDSKRLNLGPRGRERLLRAALALVHEVSAEVPRSLAGWFEALGAGGIEPVELDRWLMDDGGWDCPTPLLSVAQEAFLKGAHWRVCSAWAEVVGPWRFNRELAGAESKARVHFAAFARLLVRVWEIAADGVPTIVCADRHGGRAYYLEALRRAVPDAWIDRGREDRVCSEYVLRRDDRRVGVAFRVRADSSDGLVALASIASKTLRELWMDEFNRFWCRQLPGLRPTAGYPIDAARFRRAIEPVARRLEMDEQWWWRIK